MSTIDASTERYYKTFQSAHDGLYEVAEITTVAGGLEFYYPPMKRPAGGIITSIFGLIFTFVGIVLSQVDDAPLIFPVVFIPLGLGILSIGIWELGKSLRVELDRNSISTQRLFLKYPITSKHIATRDVKSLEIKVGATHSNGKKTTVYYSLIAHTGDRKKLVLAERLHSKPEVELVKDTIEPYCRNALKESQ